MPIFPELRAYLDQVWEEAEPGADYVITGYRGGNANLRTQLERIIRRAGLKAWPKLFQNLRSTRETELVAEFPLHVVTAWLGNTAAVATKHYLQVTEADYDRAAGGDAESGAQVVQKLVQRAAAPIRMEGKKTTQAPGLQGLVPNLATVCETVQSYPVPLAGLEPATAGLEINWQPQKTPRKPRFSSKRSEAQHSTRQAASAPRLGGDRRVMAPLARGGPRADARNSIRRLEGR